MSQTIHRSKLQSLFPLGAKVPGFVFLALGLYASFMAPFLPFLGVPMVLIGCFVLFSFSGVMIDTQQRTIKNYWSFFGSRVGKWEKLPAIRMVTVVKHTQLVSNGNRFAPSATSEHTTFQVNLKHQNGRDTLIAFRGRKEEALKKGRLFAKEFKTDFLDCTGKEKHLYRHEELTGIVQ